MARLPAHQPRLEPAAGQPGRRCLWVLDLGDVPGASAPHPVLRSRHCVDYDPALQTLGLAGPPARPPLGVEAHARRHPAWAGQKTWPGTRKYPEAASVLPGLVGTWPKGGQAIGHAMQSV